MERRRTVALVVTLLACCCAVAYDPLLVLGIKATMSVPALARPHFVLCSHDYEHVDLLCMAKVATRWYAASGIPTAFVVADRCHNHLFCSVIHRGACVPVRRRTTRKILRLLRTHHVCMFVYRDTTATGAYYVSRAHPATLLVRIRTPHAVRCTREAGRSIPDIVCSTLGSRVRVTTSAPPRPSSSSPTEYMRRLHARLYPQS